MFLQSVGLMPDNVICLESNRKKVEERIHEKLKQMHSNDNAYSFPSAIKESVDESELNLKAVKEVFKGFYAEIPTSNRKKSEIIDEIAVNKFIINYLCLNNFFHFFLIIVFIHIF
jgi:hypothetical protein